MVGQFPSFPSKRITLYDSLKGIAIIAIMFIHLGQWNLNLQEGSRLAVFRSSGLLGVEITYLINAFFLTKHYSNHDFKLSYLLKSFIRIIPVYWFGLTVYWISCSATAEGCNTGLLNILSHYFFLNGLLPSWWSGFMGGTGYFGILAIMWSVFPAYVKRIDNIKKAIFGAIIVISVSYIMMQLIKVANGLIGFETSGSLNDWLWYISRGIYCYALGCILYHFIELKHNYQISNSLTKITGYCLLLFILIRMMVQGSSFDGLLFTLLWCVFICVAQYSSFRIIDNTIFAFIGRNITELFVTHIVLYYILVQNQKIFTAGPKTLLILFIMSMVVGPIMRIVITKPFRKFNDKLCETYRCHFSDSK